MRRLCLLVRRIALLAQDPFPQAPESRLDVLAQFREACGEGVKTTTSRSAFERAPTRAAKHVRGAARLIADPDGADQIDGLAALLLVERRAGVVFRQHVLERRGVALDTNTEGRCSSGSSGAAPCARSASSLQCCSV